MPVTAHISRSATSARYEVGAHELAQGSTLGGPRAMAVVKATGAIQEVFGIEAGSTLLGTVDLRYYDRDTGAYIARAPYGSFILHPEHQEFVFDLVNGISARETIFVLTDDLSWTDKGPAAVYYRVELRNATDQPKRMTTLVTAVLRGDTAHDVQVQFDRRLNAFVVWNDSSPAHVRLVGTSIRPRSFETTLDNAKATSVTLPSLRSRTDAAPYDPLGLLEVDTDIKPGDSASFYALVTIGTSRQNARRAYREAPSATTALERTKAWFERELSKSIVQTPDEHVNQGVLWSKANMLRVESSTPTGPAFTNNPTKSSNAVARDTAWFAMGADYLDQAFSRASLLAFVERQRKDGLVVEYYDTRTGKCEDYGLNINDNTPLLVMALWHHYNITGDIDFLRRVYPAARRAVRYILSQRNGDGLVFCSTTKESSWGIVGWRNVIPNYRLSGTTTELNSECYGALRNASEMARVVERHEESGEFATEADRLREAINQHLLSSETGLYLLNIDVEGLAHSEITVDLVFPLIFGVADDDTANHVMARLSQEDFWTVAGIRTVPREAPSYSPDAGSGLLGGIWVGASFWYAFAAASHSPAFMAHALSHSFRNYAADPKSKNTVPGQFSEWLHGETLSNRGMMLSPWYPPRYLWAAIEGMAGLGVQAGKVVLTPRLPPEWKWLAVRNVPFRGNRLAWIVVRLPETHIYTTLQQVGVESGMVRLQEDITEHLAVDGEGLVGVALRDNGRLLIFVGNTRDRTVTGHVRLLIQLAEKSAYAFRRFDSLSSGWQTAESLLDERELNRGITLVVEREGFTLLDLNLAI